MYWNGTDGSRLAGRIALRASFAELDGGPRHASHSRVIPFEDIASVRYARGRVHVWSRSGAPLRLGSLDKPGALRELAERLHAAAVKSG